MELHGLPEMLGGIVEGAVQLDALVDRVPVRQDPRRNRGRGAPAVEQERLPVDALVQAPVASREDGRQPDSPADDRVLQLLARMGQQQLERLLVGHRDQPAFHAAP